MTNQRDEANNIAKTKLFQGGAAACAFGAAVGLEDLFAHAEGFGGYLDQFVVGDELDGLLEGELLVRHESEGII